MNATFFGLFVKFKFYPLIIYNYIIWTNALFQICCFYMCCIYAYFYKLNQTQASHIRRLEENRHFFGLFDQHLFVSFLLKFKYISKLRYKINASRSNKNTKI